MNNAALLAERFRRFSQTECDRSPLYQQLTRKIADDHDILDLAANSAPGQPPPNLLLAAVHYLLLSGVDHPLRSVYPSLGARQPATSDPYPLFRDFCLQHADEITHLLSTRRVQTNEVARASCLLPGFHRVSQINKQAPLALIEVGTSAGLLLLWDQFSYDYDVWSRSGDTDHQVQLSCQLRGDRMPPLPEAFPRIAARIGIDINPIDLTDPDAVLWLRALVWPDQPERAERLINAIALAQNQPLDLVTGDALEVLAGIVERLPREATLCVFHCHTLNQFPPEKRVQFLALLTRLSQARPVFHLSLEAIGATAAKPSARLELTVYNDGQTERHEILAYCDGHANWLEWLASPT